MTRNRFPVGGDDVGRRLDRVVRRFLPDVSLSAVYRDLRTGRIRVNGRRTEPGYRLLPGDYLEVAADREPKSPGAHPDASQGPEPAIDRRIILFENAAVIALNKPKGLLTHGPDSLETRVLAYRSEPTPSSLSFRPGPLHRLDRNTSGVVLFGASRAGAERFSELLRGGDVSKVYLCIVDGRLTGEHVWSSSLSRDKRSHKTTADSHGRFAATRVKALITTRSHSLVAAKIETGRTHQIRAHAAIAGYPLSGDRKYGGSALAGGYLLHAALLALSDFDTVLRFQRIAAPLPDAFEATVTMLLGSGTQWKAVYDLF